MKKKGNIFNDLNRMSETKIILAPPQAIFQRIHKLKPKLPHKHPQLIVPFYIRQLDKMKREELVFRKFKVSMDQQQVLIMEMVQVSL